MSDALKAKIRDIKDFPKKGIIFKDITPLLEDPQAFNMAINLLADRYIGQRIDRVVGGGRRLELTQQLVGDLFLRRPPRPRRAGDVDRGPVRDRLSQDVQRVRQLRLEERRHDGDGFDGERGGRYLHFRRITGEFGSGDIILVP